MLKHYFLAVYTTAMVFCAHIYSQSSTVSGKVHSTHSGIIPHVDVVLHHMPDSIQIATTLTDEEGNYKFESLKSGTYQLSAYYVEFNEFLVKHVILATDSTSAVVDFNFEVIVSQEEEVIITSQKSVVRQDPDKMVVNVESTLSNSGLTGVDVLRKMPGISVDRDGKVTMKGRSGVMVMLDDKALYMNEEQLGNLLKSLPSDLIKEIEIITSPSAKYDAVGNAGIINIKLKQGAYEGFNGAANLSLGHGVYHKWNAGINASYKKRKFSFDGGYQYNNKQNLSDFYVYRSYNETSQGLQAFKSDSYFRLPEASHSVFLKGQYHLNRKSNFGYNLNMALGKFSWDGGSVSKWIKNDNSVKSSFESHDEGYFINKNINGGIDYKYAFDTLNTNLVLGASINHNNGRIDKHFNIQYYDSTHTNQDIPYLLTQKNITDATQLSIKADFMKTLFKKFKFESGVKANHLRDYRPLTIAITESNNYKDGSNHFLYNEGVYAAYVMGNMKFGKWSGQGGLRAEHSDISGKQTLVDTTFVRSYTNLFP
ncbi:MAG TPA: outer membrane beta-barrel protein, partial [Cytophagales bacterium]|nr:outer membrane beta-barrel protein [Cytophagales bacterium]